MFFDYTLIISLLLSALFLSISAWIKRDITASTGKSQELQKKIKIYQKIYYFFSLTIFLTRLLYFVSFPQQIEDGFLFNSASGALLAPFLGIEGVFGFFYLFFMFFIHTIHEIKPPFRREYFLKLLFYLHSFIILDLSVSLIIYLLAGYYLVFPALPYQWISRMPSLLQTLSFVLGLLFILQSVAFWMVQKKRNSAGRALFLFLAITITGLALLAGIGNLQYLFSPLHYLRLFTYQNGFYAYIWLVLAFAVIVSQIAAISVHSLKEHFINRYFALNVVLQLNRITFICVFGLVANSVLPQILFSLV